MADPPVHPRVSVVMPVRNGGPHLAAAVDSILGQSYRDFEFVVVDDGSTDDTPRLLDAASARDRRVVVLRGSGAGIVSALNQGIGAARGGLVARMDADDVALPGRLDMQVAALDAGPDVVALGGEAMIIDDVGRERGRIEVATGAALAARAPLLENPFVHPTVMVRRDAALRAGLYRPGCTYAEDYDLWLRLAESGRLDNLSVPLVRFRRHRGQTSVVHRLAQRAAAALARQAALRRHAGLAEGTDMLAPPIAAIRGFLETRAGERRPVERDEARDLLVMIRLLQQEPGGGDHAALRRRLVGEAGLWRARLLPAWTFLDRRRRWSGCNGAG